MNPESWKKTFGVHVNVGRSLSFFSKMLIERDDGLNPFVEVVNAVVLIGGVDGVLTEAEAHQNRFDT